MDVIDATGTGGVGPFDDWGVADDCAPEYGDGSEEIVPVLF
jgi:hypothetical protein